jgi:hypothetical protein
MTLGKNDHICQDSKRTELNTVKKTWRLARVSLKVRKDRAVTEGLTRQLLIEIITVVCVFLAHFLVVTPNIHSFLGQNIGPRDWI